MNQQPETRNPEPALCPHPEACPNACHQAGKVCIHAHGLSSGDVVCVLKEAVLQTTRLVARLHKQIDAQDVINAETQKVIQASPFLIPGAFPGGNGKKKPFHKN